MTPLARFHAAQGKDSRGRAMADVLAWDDAALERVHDYIQWLFPLPEPSGFNPDAPLLAPEDVPALHASMPAAFARMQAFYRAERQGAWLTPGNHNLLRITRILRCLHLAGHGRMAADFLAALLALPGARATIGPVTLRHWQGALRDPA